MSEFKDRLIEFMDSERLNYKQFADSIGVGRQSINQYLSGTSPGMDFFVKLKIVYKKINLNWLINGDENNYGHNSENYSIISESNIDYKPQKNDDNMIEQLNTLRKMVDYLLQENTALKNELNELRKGQSKAAM